MTTIDKVTAAISRSIDAINRQLPAGQQVKMDEEFPLIGPAGTLDSLGFLNLLVVVEREVETEFGADLRLTEDEEILDAQSPLQTVGALIRYVADNIDATAPS